MKTEFESLLFFVSYTKVRNLNNFLKKLPLGSALVYSSLSLVEDRKSVRFAFASSKSRELVKFSNEIPLTFTHFCTFAGSLKLSNTFKILNTFKRNHFVLQVRSIKWYGRTDIWCIRSRSRWISTTCTAVCIVICSWCDDLRSRR